MARCLESVVKQDYKNVEIVISDDSPDEDTKHALEPYRQQLRIRYMHNQPALRSPQNWNHALDQAAGDLVVLMHQDDWYHADNALSLYVEAFQNNSVDFVFCQNTAIDEEGNKVILQALPRLLHEMKQKPNHLLLAQVIGPPSNTMLRREIGVRYDERFIWLVDVDYYVRLLKQGYTYHYMEKHLVSIGLHEEQTTAFCRVNNDIIFRENIWFANKLEPEAFNDLLIYDYYWRLLRNNRIKSVKDIEANKVQPQEIPPVILHMLHLQKRFSYSVLKKGVVSKALMIGSYVAWRMKKKQKQIE